MIKKTNPKDHQVHQQRRQRREQREGRRRFSIPFLSLCAFLPAELLPTGNPINSPYSKNKSCHLLNQKCVKIKIYLIP